MMFYRYHVATTLTKNEISKKVKKLIQLSNDHKNIVLGNIAFWWGDYHSWLVSWFCNARVAVDARNEIVK